MESGKLKVELKLKRTVVFELSWDKWNGFVWDWRIGDEKIKINWEEMDRIEINLEGWKINGKRL